MLRPDPDEKLKPDERDSIIPNSILTSAKTIIEIPTKSYVDSFYESSRNRRDLSSVFNDQDNDLDSKKIADSDSVSVNRNPSSDNEIAYKKYVDDSIGDGNVLSFCQTLENYLKLFVGNDVKILLKMIKNKL